MMGNWALSVALPVYVYEATGSTLATGLLVVARTVPRIMLGSVAGIFVDRLDRQRVLIVSNLLSFLALLPLGAVPYTDWVWLVYVVALLQTMTSLFFDPAENAFLPSVVGEEQLASANALNALNNNLARLIGPALGGVVMGLSGLTGVVIFDAATFLIAALLIAFVNAIKEPPAQVEQPVSGTASPLGAVWREWLEGLRLVRQNRAVTLLFIIVAITSLGEGVMATLFIPFVTDILKGQALEVGWLMSAQAIGGIVGGAVISSVASKIASYRLLGWGAVGLGVIDLAIFNYPFFISGVTLGLVLFALAGLPVSGLQAGLLTLFQSSVVDRFRGRVFGAFGTTMALFNLVGVSAAGLLGGPLGIVPVINLQGVVYVLAGIIALAFLKRHVRASVAA